MITLDEGHGGGSCRSSEAFYGRAGRGCDRSNDFATLFRLNGAEVLSVKTGERH
ncbi:MAG: hypothetical protein ACTS5A_03375 [Candidatus Hodgkinia cicadicola]